MWIDKNISIIVRGNSMSISHWNLIMMRILFNFIILIKGVYGLCKIGKLYKQKQKNK